MIRAMQHPQGSRIDLGEIKRQIVKKIGVEKSRKYFYYLGKFLSQKLSKSEFDKSCYRLIGRDNLPLHNLLICSILKNASHTKAAPLLQDAGHPSKSLVHFAKGSSCTENRPEQSGFLLPNQTQNVPIWSNGVLPVSPRKVRSSMRDRKIRDRPSPLGPNGKVEGLLQQSIGREDNSGKLTTENGDLGHNKHQEPGRFDRKREVSVLQGAEIPRVLGKNCVEAASNKIVEEEREDEQDRIHLLRSPLVAPLGIPFCPASIGGACKTAPVLSSSNFTSCYGSSGLLESDAMRKRLDSIAASHELGGVSTECANMLNNMLDMYLKRLIKSCVDLVGARSANGSPRMLSVVDKRQIQSRVLNGTWPGNKLQDVMQDQHSISLLDFRVAMELNPHLLGEDWPLLLERITTRSFVE